MLSEAYVAIFSRGDDDDSGVPPFMLFSAIGLVIVTLAVTPVIRKVSGCQFVFGRIFGFLPALGAKRLSVVL